MPKISIQALRGLMVLVNVMVLAGVGLAAHNLFLGDRGELKIQLADASEFEPKVGPDDRDQKKILGAVLGVISAQPPPPPAPKPVTPPPSQLRANGPLDEYVYRGGIIGPTPMAIISEKEPTTTSSRRRTRPSRARGRSRNTKRRARPANVPKSWHVWEGTNFKGCLINEIRADEIIYSQGTANYVLKKGTAESQLELESDGIKLVGKAEDGDVTGPGSENSDPPGQIIQGGNRPTAVPPGTSRSPTSRRPQKPSAEDLQKLKETLRAVEKSDPKAAEQLKKSLGNTTTPNGSRKN